MINTIQGVFRRNPAFRLACCYLVLTVVCGIVLVFFDARPATNDLDDHWSHAYLLSQGQLVPMENPEAPGHFGGYIDGEFVEFNNTAVNSPLAYFPSLFSGGNYTVACVLTLIVASIVTAAGVALAEAFAPIVLAVALLPFVFFSFLYPTADAMTDSVSILFIGAVLHAYQSDRVSNRFVAFLALVAIFMGLVKSTCVILLALLLLPFHGRYARTAAFDWRLAVPAVVGCAVAVLWGRAIAGIGPVYQPYDEFQAGIWQIASHPLHYAKTIAISLFQPLDFTSDPGNVGRNSQLVLGSEFTQLPITVMGPILLACALLLIRGNGANGMLDRVDVAIVLGVAVLFFAGTHFAMLASWSASQLGLYNQGIQTRYFIPELPLVGLLIPCFALSIEKSRTFGVFTAALLAFGYAGILVAHLMPIG